MAPGESRSPGTSSGELILSTRRPIARLSYMRRGLFREGGREGGYKNIGQLQEVWLDEKIEVLSECEGGTDHRDQIKYPDESKAAGFERSSL